MVPGELAGMKDCSDATLRRLLASDIPAAMQLSTEAGWNQTADDWRMLLELSPRGCLAVELDGQVVSTATLLCYGRRLAWIGMVLTKMSCRGRGLARRLLTEALTIADQMKIETVKLDATDHGEPLYTKLGFRQEQPVERWIRPGYIALPKPQSRADTNLSLNWHVSDSAAFGVDRSEVLKGLTHHTAPLSAAHSFLLSRPGRVHQYLGPCIAETPVIARTLIENALQTPSPEGWAWDLLPANTASVAIAHDCSFSPKRRLMRMVRGKDLRTQENRIYAIAGFELG
jgi:predicted GNAT family acetyltransferase